MCSHYQALKERERYQRHFGVEPPPEPGKLDLWPGYLGSFIRRHPHADVGDDAVPEHRMPELGQYGSVRGVLSNGCLYRDCGRAGGLPISIQQTSNAILEEKTSALPSAQIYSGVGQMHYYKYRYGHSKTKRYLVWPLSCKSTETQNFIESLVIAVVYGESWAFNFPNGASLAADV